MTTVILPLPGNEELARLLAGRLDMQQGVLSVRRFPDGESYIRYRTPIKEQRVVLVCTLDRPDEKLLPLVFAAATARDLGAVEVGLVAPYLAYMRQDRRFKPGEAITSAVFARILDRWVDWLVTVDPHLHRRRSLAEIYSIPCVAVHAAPAISSWIGRNVANPVFIGPDTESAQWVAAVAEGAGAPFTVLEKTRRGDRDVEISIPDVKRWRGRTPVLVDDIISTARTMIETVKHLMAACMAPPVCVGVHAVFAGTAYEELQAAGAASIVTCNTIAHTSNGIDISEWLVNNVKRMSVHDRLGR